MSNILWLPLVLGMLLSAYVAYRTQDNVRLRAIVAFIAVAAIFSLTYVPELSGQLAPIGIGITDFVAYVLGTGWLSQVWLVSIVMDAIRRFTRTQIWESEDLSLVLDAIVLLGFAWLFWSFITGHPMRAFG